MIDDARPFPLLLLPVLLAGCSKSADNAAAPDNVANVATVETIEDGDAVPLGNQAADARLPTDDWVGKWTGPEGLFLDIQRSPNGKPGHYALTNKDKLDRQGDYAGVAEGMTIRFARDGKDLVIRPGTGEQTGFKYLAGKTDCLIVVVGQEGYCR
ncbi:hypothetical protein U5A82_07855 [Sphingobium sp. CR2-8]|uniref:hypothetical protein n=1 Tax=Sphingobium sp. CR2-8 TaxID=1306534 RepID=UPI002DBDDCAA|nr:hypothetical protein [Sphingobium sp. CR2-8]MEC3910397.1 hypothetical protein [Sphingobium sp. CR2-8]